MTNYEEFSTDPTEQSGHYLVLDFDAESGAKIETMITGGKMQDYVDATTDKYCVYRVQNTSQTIKVKVSKSEQSVENVYKLTDLVLL